MLNGKASSDIGSASSALQGTINSTQADLISLAQGGMAGSDEFAKTLGRQSDAYNSLTTNPSFGYTSDQAAVDRKNNALNVTAATIQGSMATAFKDGGINAAQAIIPSIDDHPGATDADKAQLHVWADGYLKTLQASNTTDIAANTAAFDAWEKAGEKDPKNRAPLYVLQGLQNKAFRSATLTLPGRAAVAIATHNYATATSGLSPSQHDAINGVGQPAPAAHAGITPDGAALVGAHGGDVDRAVADALTKRGEDSSVNRSDLRDYLRTGGHDLDPATQAWCAAFVGAALEHAGIKSAGDFANDYQNWGQPVTGAVKKGDVVIESRGLQGGEKGGHIGIATGDLDSTGRIEIVSGNAGGSAKGGGFVGNSFVDPKSVVIRRAGGSQQEAAPVTGAIPDSYYSRLHQIENPRDVTTTNSAGATGKYQFIPATWNQFGGGGNVHSDADQEVAVRKYTQHNLDALTQALGRPPMQYELYLAHQQGAENAIKLIQNPNAKAGNISGNAAISQNGGDPNGPASAFVQHWARNFGGNTAVAGGSSGALPGAPSMTWEDLKNNPYASAAYAHTLAADETTRTRTGEALLESSTRGLQNGVMPSQQTMVQIEQLAADNPKLAEKYDKYAVELGARQPQTMVGGGAGSQPFIDQLRAQAMATPDILARQIVEKKQEIRDASQRLLDSNPVAASINGRWTSRAPVPLDPTQPQTIPQHFSENAATVDAIVSREPDFSKSVVFKNETGQFGAAMAGPAQVGSAILQSIGSLPQDKRDATLEMPEVRAAILGMAASPDAQKKQVAFSFMDQIYRQDPQSFDGKFGEKGLLKLRAWQDVEQFKTPEMIAKDASTANDPSAIRARDDLVNQSNKDTQTMTSGQIAQRISSHFLGLFDNTPISSNSSMTNAVMADDWRRARGAGFSEMGDATAAERYADERTRLKWGESPSNGNRVMTYPPERSPAYPMVNGSHDYIGAQLANFVTQAGHPGAEAHLVPDANTESEMKFGKAPGYAVVAQGNDGQYHLIPGRFYADPSSAQAQANAGFRQAPPLHVPMAMGMMTGGVP